MARTIGDLEVKTTITMDIGVNPPTNTDYHAKQVTVEPVSFSKTL